MTVHDLKNTDVLFWKGKSVNYVTLHIQMVYIFIWDMLKKYLKAKIRPNLLLVDCYSTTFSVTLWHIFCDIVTSLNLSFCPPIFRVKSLFFIATDIYFKLLYIVNVFFSHQILQMHFEDKCHNVTLSRDIVTFLWHCDTSEFDVLFSYLLVWNLCKILLFAFGAE